METSKVQADEAIGMETPSPTKGSSVSDTLLGNVISLTAPALLALLVLLGGSEAWTLVADEWVNLATWVALILGIELLPIFAEDQEITWTLDVPLLLAVAVLYPPEVAATVAFVAALDAREFRSPRVRPVRALFNRAQVALSVYSAALVLRALGTTADSVPGAALGVAIALVVDYTVNLGLASLLLAARRHVPWRTVFVKFSIGPRRVFLATFFGYGLLAFVMAYLASQAGVWAVAIPLLPTLVARQALIREQRLQETTKKIQHQERLLEKAVDRAIDERQDERLRVSGELHDEVLQSLTHVVMLGRLLGKDNQSRQQVQQDIQDLILASERALDALQDVISGLRRSPLGRGGLVPTLQGLARDMRLDWQTDIQYDLPADVPLEPDAQVIIYQIAREALVNAVKYSRSPQIRLSLRHHGEWIELVVEDDGVGFNATEVDHERHFGLGLMEERARRLGSTLNLTTKVNGNGTRLELRVSLGGAVRRGPLPEVGPRG